MNDKKETVDKNDNNTKMEQILRRSNRIRKQPDRYEDCDMAHLALSADIFVNDTPGCPEIAKTRTDYKYWKEAVDEEIKTLEKNKT